MPLRALEFMGGLDMLMSDVNGVSGSLDDPTRFAELSSCVPSSVHPPAGIA